MPHLRLLLEGDLFVVVDAAVAALELALLDARRTQLALLLQRRQTPCLLQLLLPRFALRLLAPKVGGLS